MSIMSPDVLVEQFHLQLVVGYFQVGVTGIRSREPHLCLSPNGK